MPTVPGSTAFGGGRYAAGLRSVAGAASALSTSMFQVSNAIQERDRKHKYAQDSLEAMRALDRLKRGINERVQAAETDPDFFGDNQVKELMAELRNYVEQEPSPQFNFADSEGQFAQDKEGVVTEVMTRMNTLAEKNGQAFAALKFTGYVNDLADIVHKNDELDALSRSLGRLSAAFAKARPNFGTREEQDALYRESVTTVARGLFSRMITEKRTGEAMQLLRLPEVSGVLDGTTYTTWLAEIDAANAKLDLKAKEAERERRKLDSERRRNDIASYRAQTERMEIEYLIGEGKKKAKNKEQEEKAESLEKGLSQLEGPNDNIDLNLTELNEVSDKMSTASEDDRKRLKTQGSGILLRIQTDEKNLKVLQKQAEKEWLAYIEDLPPDKQDAARENLEALKETWSNEAEYRRVRVENYMEQLQHMGKAEIENAGRERNLVDELNKLEISEGEGWPSKQTVEYTLHEVVKLKTSAYSDTNRIGPVDDSVARVLRAAGEDDPSGLIRALVLNTDDAEPRLKALYAKIDARDTEEKAQTDGIVQGVEEGDAALANAGEASVEPSPAGAPAESSSASVGDAQMILGITSEPVARPTAAPDNVVSSAEASNMTPEERDAATNVANAVKRDPSVVSKVETALSPQVQKLVQQIASVPENERPSATESKRLVDTATNRGLNLYDNVDITHGTANVAMTALSRFELTAPLVRAFGENPDSRIQLEAYGQSFIRGLVEVSAQDQRLTEGLRIYLIKEFEKIQPQLLRDAAAAKLSMEGIAAYLAEQYMQEYDIVQKFEAGGGEGTGNLSEDQAKYDMNFIKLTLKRLGAPIPISFDPTPGAQGVDIDGALDRIDQLVEAKLLDIGDRVKINGKIYPIKPPKLEQ